MCSSDLVAALLGTSVEAAAARIEDAIDGQLGRDMARFLADRGVDPGDVTVYGFGGGGPVHLARACTAAGIRRMRTFPFGAVFSAFGCTAVDVRHRYEVLAPTGGYTLDGARADAEELVRRAGWDLQAEGFGGRGGTCHLVIEGVDGGRLGQTGDVDFGPGVARDLVDAAWPLPAGAATVALVVNVPIGVLSGTPTTTLTREAGTAERGVERTLWWGASPTRARVTAIGELPVGSTSRGPAVVLDGEAVCVVPPNWAVTRDPDGGLLWERTA